MQNLFRKFPVFLLIFLSTFSQVAFSQDVNIELKKADSLFNLKKFTQAYQVYENLYNEREIYTPQMLIKMAYIQEGIESYTNSLYYLNKYFLLTNDRNAREKMQELAEKHHLEGYEYSDFKFIFNLYRYYRLQINFVFVLVISILVAWIVFNKYQYKKRLVTPSLTLLFLLGLFLMINLFHSFYSTAIVSTTTYLMNGPSAGADVIEVVQPGNKITITGSEDIWNKVSLGDKVGFIKKHNLRLLD